MTYAGLTISDKPALLDAKARGYIYVVYRENEPLAFWRTSPDRLDSIIGYDMIDIALAQIAEIESKQNNALSEKASEKGCMTWNERINQMTVEEKADVAVILSKRCARALEKESCPDLTCWQCFIEFFNSPYTEGEKHEG